MRTAKRTTFSRNVVISEPVWDETETSLPLILNWYSYNKTQEDAKEYLIQYAKHVNLDKADLKILTNSKVRINTSIAWLSRIYLNSLSETFPLKTNIDTELQRLLSDNEDKQSPQEVEVVKKPVANVQENIKIKLSEYVGELNYQLDQIISAIRKECTYSFCLKTWLRENEISGIQAKNISLYFKNNVLNEFLEAQAGLCEQLVESYSFLTEKQLSAVIEVVERFVQDCDELHTIKKQISIHNRTPRKTTKNPLKQVKNLKYLKEHEQLKSIVPTKIIGAKAILLYNPKTRCVVYYECDNNHGLAIKGCAVLNYDVTKTLCKTMRKPDEHLSKFMSEGRVAIRNTIKELKSKNKVASGRINGTFLILRAF